jgi:hypothetical protein
MLNPTQREKHSGNGCLNIFYDCATRSSLRFLSATRIDTGSILEFHRHEMRYQAMRDTSCGIKRPDVPVCGIVDRAGATGKPRNLRRNLRSIEPVRCGHACAIISAITGHSRAIAPSTKAPARKNPIATIAFAARHTRVLFRIEIQTATRRSTARDRNGYQTSVAISRTTQICHGLNQSIASGARLRVP